MTSAIDVTVPIYGNPTTKSVRDNFVAAHDEIGALQTDVATRVKKSGDTMQGFLELYRDPEIDMQAATKRYVDSKSGGASLTVADIPPSIANGKMWFDSIGTQLYIGYDDGNTKQWVIATNPNVQQSSAALQPLYNNIGRNLIHNGLFQVAQRGSGPWVTNGSYTVDRWKISSSLDALSFTISSASDAVRAAIGDESISYMMALSVTGNAGAGSYTAFIQCIEGLRRFGGKTVTLSFWAAASGSITKLGANFLQVFGIGGSPSPDAWAQTNGAVVTVSGTWTRYSMTFTLPTQVGKTLGTAGNDCMALWFWLSSGATNNTLSGNVGVQNGTLYLAGVQLEYGNVATPLEKLDPQIDLANCQRFYLAGQQGVFAGNANANATIAGSVFYPVAMRAAPTFAITNNSDVNVSSPTQTAFNSNSGMWLGGNATTAGSWIINRTFTASADL